ncbi:hypothetical protein LO762_28180 [Actinocorallia sp. API 0066]|uniref:hypothetical protein n=1 Tax=Actinocorallia sp. API 0066 TaxID=2896846 RepID=UPI001E423DB9|nr:hypothetical protein [Actinocorallia sp. API 0066]MCD0453031.1 hypothetical protein [Actinocorallia sp. API 0066]
MESAPVELSLAAIRSALDQLSRHLESCGEGATIRIDNDAFWAISGTGADLYEPPPEPTIGLVSESWENLQSMISGDAVIGYGFVWLADVLRAIGREFPA